MNDIKNVVKMALLKGGKKQVDLGAAFGMSAASISNKIRGGRLSWDDLAMIAEFTGGKLCIVYPDGDNISIDAAKKNQA